MATRSPQIFAQRSANWKMIAQGRYLENTFVRTFADGISASVLAAHREHVRWTARHDERNIGTGIGWRIRHLGQLYINRFTESVCDSAGNLLGVAEH
jgi:hypothetical protein